MSSGYNSGLCLNLLEIRQLSVSIIDLIEEVFEPINDFRNNFSTYIFHYFPHLPFIQEMYTEVLEIQSKSSKLIYELLKENIIDVYLENIDFDYNGKDLIEDNVFTINTEYFIKLRDVLFSNIENTSFFHKVLIHYPELISNEIFIQHSYIMFMFKSVLPSKLFVLSKSILGSINKLIMNLNFNLVPEASLDFLLLTLKQEINSLNSIKHALLTDLFNFFKTFGNSN